MMPVGQSQGKGGAHEFSNPGPAYWPQAYWFWHHMPDAGEIVAQLQDLYDGGYRTVLVQCRLAFPRSQYLNAEFLQRLELVANTAERLNMQLGIYDDYNWQSGMAGGRTVEGHDELREQHVFWTDGAASATTCLTVTGIQSSITPLGKVALQWQYEGGQVQWADWVVVAALLYPATDPTLAQVQDVTSCTEIAFSSQHHCEVRVSLPHDTPPHQQLTVFVSARSKTSRVPNYLRKETAERFLTVGYEPIRQQLGRHFGTTVSYFFYDQPHATFYHWNEHKGNLRSSLPWCEDLGQAIETATHRPIGLHLLALVENLGQDTRALRTEFYQIFTHIALERFFGPLGAWAAQYGVGFTGHEVLGHVGGWPLHQAFSHADLRVNFGMDYFGIDSYRSLTAVDAEGTAPQISAKLGDSVSRSHGRRGCMVEQYFISPAPDTAQYIGRWDLTLEALRAQTIRQYLAGARQLLFHAYTQTPGTAEDLTPLQNPRFDFAPGINFEPWWPFHDQFARESARLSAFLQGAEPVTEVAILFPLRTAWAEGPHHSYGEHVGHWARLLTEAGYGFDLIDERELTNVAVASGRLRLGTREYQALVLPAVTTLKTRSSFEQIARFLAEGGFVLASGDTLTSYQTDAHDARHDWSSLTRGHSRSIWMSNPTEPFHAVFDSLDSLRAERPYAASVEKSQVWQWVGRDQNGWRIALFNDQTVAIPITVHLPSARALVSTWDVASGDIAPLGRVEGPLLWWLDPMELVCLHVARPADCAPSDSQTISRECGASLTRLLSNSKRMGLSGWRFSPDKDRTFLPIDVTRPWESQGYADFSGMGTYVCEISLPGEEGWIYLPEVGTAVTVTVNGVNVGQRGWRPYLFHVPADVVHSGLNRVQVNVYNTAANAYYAHTPYQFATTASGLYATPEWVWGLAESDLSPI